MNSSDQSADSRGSLTRRRTFRYSHGNVGEIVSQCNVSCSAFRGGVALQLSGTELSIRPQAPALAKHQPLALTLMGDCGWTLDHFRSSKIVLHGYQKHIFARREKVELDFDDKEECKKWHAALGALFQISFDKHYRIVNQSQPLGTGSFAVVYAGQDRNTGEKVAIKVVKTPARLIGRRVNEESARSNNFVARELHILRHVKHENIVGTYDIFNCQNDVKVVMEMCKGHLFDTLAEQNKLTEAQAASIMRDLFSALTYLHARDIVHRDIKPDNLMTTSRTWPMTAKLADFGLSNYSHPDASDVDEERVFTSAVGTPLYVAPELFSHEPYTKAVDLWSCGVLLYVILSGKVPFSAKNVSQLQKIVQTRDVEFPRHRWDKISDDAKRLIRGLLQRDPAKRLSAVGALNHDWLQREHDVEQIIGNDLSELGETFKRTFRRVVNLNRIGMKLESECAPDEGEPTYAS